MTPTETTVSAICAEILGLDSVGLDDDLYELGSDSHQAVLVALEIERTFGVELPLGIMESAAKVRTLAAWIDEQRAKREPGAAASSGEGGAAGADV